MYNHDEKQKCMYDHNEKEKYMYDHDEKEKYNWMAGILRGTKGKTIYLHNEKHFSIIFEKK